MAIARPLFESSDLYFAELVCRPDDPEWGEENVVTHPIVALPTTPVWQARSEPATERGRTQAVGGSVPLLSSFGQDQQGELYALSLAGGIYKLQP